MKKKIRKVKNGKVRVIGIDEFVQKLIEKKAISKTDKMFYLKNPNVLCKFLNEREKKFGVKYSLA